MLPLLYKINATFIVGTNIFLGDFFAGLRRVFGGNELKDVSFSLARAHLSLCIQHVHRTVLDKGCPSRQERLRASGFNHTDNIINVHITCF